MTKDNVSFTQQIKPIRDEIDTIDAQIISLLSQRREQVKKVVAVKKEYKVPIYHPAREEDVISRLRGKASDMDVDPDLVENLYRTIMHQSRKSQTRVSKTSLIRPQAKILIVGGAGEMGRLFVRFFTETGYQVDILDKNEWDRAEALCKNADLVVVCVPINVTVKVIDDLAPLMRPDAVLTDLTSVKKIPLEAMCRAHKGPVLGLHPLFGPTTDNLDKQIIAACAGQGDDACQWVIDQLVAWGAVVIETSAKEHDQIMEIVQALRHFATFSFGSFLYRQGIPIKRTLEFSSPIYRLELGMVGRLFAQDPDLYADIIFATPERRRLLKTFVQSLNQFLDMLESGDKDAFIKEFKQIAEWFGPFGHQALRESTYFINKLIERF